MFKRNKQKLHFQLNIFFFADNEIKIHFHKILELNKRLSYLQSKCVILKYDGNRDFVKFLSHALNNL